MEVPTSWAQSGIIEAHERIRNVIFRTPLIFSHSLSAKASNLYGGTTNVYLKLESEQLTGSFKARGAFNKLILYKDSGKEFTTSSTGASCVSAENADFSSTRQPRGRFCRRSDEVQSQGARCELSALGSL